MANIVVKPFMMGDCTFRVGADNYEAHLSGVVITPTVPNAKFKGLTPTSVHNFPGASEWVAALTYAQDWNTADSLSRYLHEHEGEKIAVEFAPVAGGPSITATITIVPGSIGGQVDSVATSTVNCPIDGKPQIGAVVP